MQEGVSSIILVSIFWEYHEDDEVILGDTLMNLVRSKLSIVEIMRAIFRGDMLVEKAYNLVKNWKLT